MSIFLVRTPPPPTRAMLAAVALGFLLCASCATTRRPGPPPAPARTEPRPEPAPEEATEIEAADADVDLPVAGTRDTGATLLAEVAPEPAEEPEAPSIEPPSHSALGVLLPATIRVGLETDLDHYRPSPLRGGVLHTSAGDVRLEPDTEIRPAASAAGRGHYRLQVAALRDANLAERQAKELAAKTSQPANVVFDAKLGLFKVHVGRYADRDQAERARGALEQLGVESSWIVHEDQGLAEAGMEITTAGRVRAVRGRWIGIEGPEGVVVQGGQSYRGTLLVFLNDRGRLNLVNELPFEDYLRGVVPMELGPDLYPEIEALKAQAVAARTYTLRNLAEFAREGFDICASPRCQVYGGLAAERPLSDEAITETVGQVLFFGERPVDALYSAICGGHTEDVDVVFPQRHEPYLKGVPCLESGITLLPSSKATMPLVQYLAMTLSATEPSTVPTWEREGRKIGARLQGLALRYAPAAARTAAPPGATASDVARYLTVAFDLFLPREMLAYLRGGERPATTAARDERLLDALEGLHSAPRGQALELGGEDHLVVDMARYLGAYEQREVSFERLASGSSQAREIVVARRGNPTRWRLAREVQGYRRSGAEVAPAQISLGAGDPIDLHIVDGEVVAIVQQSPGRIPRDIHRSRPAEWTRYRSAGQLRSLVARQFPGFVLRDLEVLKYGASGRVGELELLSTEGRRERVEGLAVRWLLDLPDTRFTFEPAKRAGETGWVFHGSGWGHGVGLCQTGAFGMAQRGLDYSQILTHYYSGVDLITLESKQAGDLPPSPWNDAIASGSSGSAP